MKPRTLPVKRVPANPGILRRLYAATGNRKQRVAASAAASPADMETEDSGSRISRALTVIFLIHIVVIGLIYFHQKYMSGRTPDIGREEAIRNLAVAPAAPLPTELPRLSSGEKPYIVQPGDNYERIANNLQVDEQDLRVLNKHADISQGLILRIPPKKIVAEEPPEVAALRARSTTAEVADSGLVPAVDVSRAPKATPVRTNEKSTLNAPKTAEAAATASGKIHVVQPGESIFRIAGRYKVDQNALMKANSIPDPKKMKVGMKLVIPAK